MKDFEGSIKNDVRLSFTFLLKLISQILTNPEVRKILSEKIDVMISMPVTGNEIAYFLAYKQNASMVLWSPQQNPFSIYDFAIGQPHNPAYIPNIFTSFR